MRRKMTEKPKNLQFKARLCEKLRIKVKPIDLSHNGYAWTYYQARYLYEDYNIIVYFQRYVRNKSRINYIKIYHSKSYEPLSKAEMVDLYDKLSVKDLKDM